MRPLVDPGVDPSLWARPPVVRSMEKTSVNAFGCRGDSFVRWRRLRSTLHGVPDGETTPRSARPGTRPAAASSPSPAPARAGPVEIISIKSRSVYNNMNTNINTNINNTNSMY